ncbi:hypothetical protein IKS86_03465 [bacterium]|nr:hypothetical protein [bacterium]
MKKLLLFLTVFFFFGILIAEEVQVYKDGSMILLGESWSEQESKAEPEPEKEPEVEKQEEEVAPETKEKPEFFYIQPLGGIEISDRYFSFIAALDTYFLINNNADTAVDVYLGTEIGFKYTPVIDYHDSSMYAHVFELPIQALFFIDAQVNPQYSTHLGGWFALGPDLIWENDLKDTNPYHNAVKYITWFVCGLGLNISVDDFVIKLGVSGSTRNFDFIVLAGYRF